MPDLHSLPAGTWPEQAIRNNGPDDAALERYKIRELAEGWPSYRLLTFPNVNVLATTANGKTLSRYSTQTHLFTPRGRAVRQFLTSSKPRKQAWTAVCSSCIVSMGRASICKATE